MCRDLHRGRARSRAVSARAAQPGFTLVELMIVVAIVAILAVIVVPSYQSYVLKARRTDAKAALTTAAQMLERFATEHPKDGYKVATLGNAGVSDKSENGHYRLILVNAGIASYTLRAEPLDGQSNDACKTFTLTADGTRDVVGTSKTPQECWQ